MESDTVVIMEILDGHSFRNTFGVMKSETDILSMTFKQDIVEVSFVNRSKCAYHCFTIDTSEITPYSFTAYDEDGNPEESRTATFRAVDMYNTTKGIGRRDSIRIYWLTGDNKLSVQQLKNSAKQPGGDGALFVPLIDEQGPVSHDIVKGYSDTPHIKYQARAFADLCTQANGMKCVYLKVEACEDCVIFTSLRANGVEASVHQQKALKSNSNPTPAALPGYLNDIIKGLSRDNGMTRIGSGNSSGGGPRFVVNPCFSEINIPISTVKALSKFHNISPAGTQLRFYFAESAPMKIESPVSTYGKYAVCIRNGKL